MLLVCDQLYLCIVHLPVFVYLCSYPLYFCIRVIVLSSLTHCSCPMDFWICVFVYSSSFPAMVLVSDHLVRGLLHSFIHTHVTPSRTVHTKHIYTMPTIYFRILGNTLPLAVCFAPRSQIWSTWSRWSHWLLFFWSIKWKTCSLTLSTGEGEVSEIECNNFSGSCKTNISLAHNFKDLPSHTP